jgi:hypothetical protein
MDIIKQATEQQIERAWEGASVRFSKDPGTTRYDGIGARIDRVDLGNDKSRFGWFVAEESDGSLVAFSVAARRARMLAPLRNNTGR